MTVQKRITSKKGRPPEFLMIVTHGKQRDEYAVSIRQLNAYILEFSGSKEFHRIEITII